LPPRALDIESYAYVLEMPAALAFPSGKKDDFIACFLQHIHLVPEKSFGIGRWFCQYNADALFLIAHIEGVK
jgi:hypothetical protein